MRPSVSRSADDWKRDFDLMKASGITGIIPEVYNGRQTLFRSTRLPMRASWLESAIPIATVAGAPAIKFAMNAPNVIPGHNLLPKMIRIASAMPDGGHTMVAKPLTASNCNPTVAAATYAALTMATEIANARR